MLITSLVYILQLFKNVVSLHYNFIINIMAYITTEEVKVIREEIKNAFPKNFKFSISREHYSLVNVALMESPLIFKSSSKTSSRQLSVYNHKTVYRIINDIVNRKNFDKSDLMVDFHHVGFYSNITLGKWDKPYKNI